MKLPVAISLALLAAACSDESDRRASLIDVPRILAISAEPPILGPGETAELRALVVAPDGSVDDLELSWRACAPWTVVLDPAVDCGPERSQPLSDAALTAPADLDADVEVPIVAEAEVDGVTLVAVKRVRMMAAPPAARGNPALVDVRVGDDDSMQVITGREYELAVDLELPSMPADATADDEPWARVYLYGTTGEIAEPAVDVELDANGAVIVDPAFWRAPDEPGLATLWVVAIDDDGGVSWRELELDAVAAP